jgi:hypothetical protein
MQAVDEAMRLVQLCAQRQQVSAVVTGATGRCARVPTFRGAKLARDGSDVFVQLSKQRPRLSHSRVLNHAWIVSPMLNVRAAGSPAGTAAIGSSNPVRP